MKNISRGLDTLYPTNKRLSNLNLMPSESNQLWNSSHNNSFFNESQPYINSLLNSQVHSLNTSCQNLSYSKSLGELTWVTFQTPTPSFLEIQSIKKVWNTSLQETPYYDIMTRHMRWRKQRICTVEEWNMSMGLIWE